MRRHFFFAILFSALSLFADQESFSEKAWANVSLITGQSCEEEIDLQIGGFEDLSLKRIYCSFSQSSPELGQAWRFAFPKELQSLTPKGNILHVQRNAEGKILQVQLMDLSGECLASLTWTYLENFDFIVEGSHGGSSRYFFDEQKNLIKVQRDFLPDISYGWGPYGLLSRQYGELHAIVSHYYDAEDSEQEGKISEQVLKNLLTKEEIVQGHFSYRDIHARDGERVGRCTYLRDAFGKEIRFYFDAADLLLRREILIPSDSGHLDIHSVFFQEWGQDKKLLRAYVENASGHLLSYQAYSYDKKQRLIKQTLSGNLSTFRSQPLKVSQWEHIESSHEYFSYDSKGRLSEKKQDNGLCTQYSYWKNTPCIASELLSFRNRIIKRKFIEYDNCLRPLQIISDDGRSSQSKDTNYVSQRYIQNFSYGKDHFGKPRLIEQKEESWDPIQKVKHLKNRYQYHYDPRGFCIQKDIFDAYNAFAYSLFWEKDPLGKTLSESDASGRKSSYRYDSFGKKTFEDTSGKAALFYSYDSWGRLDRVFDQKGETALSISYNAMGLKEEETNAYGQTTGSTYDCFGRVSKRIDPSLDLYQAPLSSIEIHYSYDPLGRLISEKGPEGQEIRRFYNARGDITRIEKANGEVENFVYTLDGKLSSHTKSDASFEEYSWDCLGRLVKTKSFNAAGNLLSWTQKQYDAFHEVRTSSSEGSSLYREYDLHGRIKSKKNLSFEQPKEVNYSYNALGQISSEREKNIYDESKSYFEKDFLDRILSIHTKNASGELLEQKNFRYDSQGHCIFESTQNSQITRSYDDEGRLQSLSLSPHQVETFSYTSSLSKSLPYKEAEKVCHKLDGSSLRILYDAKGREKMRSQYNPSGQIIKTISFLYTLSGELASQEENWGKGSYGRLRDYNDHGEIISLREFYKGQEKLRTNYTHLNGCLKSLEKNDGTELEYSYNDFQCITSLASSDGTVYYSYHYDAKGQIEAIKDLIEGTETLYTYDAYGNILSETLGNGLTISYRYDLRHRLSGITLPDASSIDYQYQASLLQNIERRRPHQEDYLISLKHYEDKSLAQVSLHKSGSKLSIDYQYQHKGRVNSIATKHWQGQFLYRDNADLESAKIKDEKGRSLLYYHYNSQEQLVGEEEILADTKNFRSYDYDPLHHRLQKDTESYLYNEKGQLTQAGECELVYDANGNIIQETQGSTSKIYRYDALDRLVSFEIPSKLRMRYVYDALHRRLSKQGEKWEDGQWKQDTHILYLYHDKDQIASYHQTQEGLYEPIALRVLNPQASFTDNLAIELQGDVFQSCQNPQGSVVHLEQLGGDEHFTQKYSAFGEPLLSDFPTDCPWTFMNQQIDTESSLLYFGHRYYHSSLGIWTTPDPLGNYDGLNPYAFVHSNPLNKRDSYGCFALWNSMERFYEENIIGAYEEVRDFLIPPQIQEDFYNGMSRFIIYFAPFGQNACCEGGHPHHILGKGELNDKIRISHAHGIYNDLAEASRMAQLISDEHGGINVHMCHHHHINHFQDLLKTILSHNRFYLSEGHELARHWRELIEEIGGLDGGGKIIHYSHSQGSIHVNIALDQLTAEEKHMITIHSLGGPENVLDKDCASVNNYLSSHDYAALTFNWHALRAAFFENDHIEFFTQFFEQPLGLDHFFFTGSHRLQISKLGKNFIASYGRICS